MEIPESDVDELFEGQSEDEELLHHLQAGALELPDGWTGAGYSELLEVSIP